MKTQKLFWPRKKAQKYVNGWIHIEIRQQNESHRLYNVYVGYGDKALTLHTMAHESLDAVESCVCRIIEMNPNWLPHITRETY